MIIVFTVASRLPVTTRRRVKLFLLADIFCTHKRWTRGSYRQNKYIQHIRTRQDIKVDVVHKAILSITQWDQIWFKYISKCISHTKSFNPAYYDSKPIIALNRDLQKSKCVVITATTNGLAVLCTRPFAVTPKIILGEHKGLNLSHTDN